MVGDQIQITTDRPGVTPIISDHLTGPTGHQGNSIRYQWGKDGYPDTTLALWLVDYNENPVGDTTYTSLKGDTGNDGPQGYSISAAFNGYDLVVSSTNPNVPDISQNVRGEPGIQGDSLTARFNDTTTLTVYSVDTATGIETELTHADLKGPPGPPGVGNSTTYKKVINLDAGVTETSFVNDAGTSDFTWSLSQYDTNTGRTVYKTAEVSATENRVYIGMAPSTEARTFTFNYTVIRG